MILIITEISNENHAVCESSKSRITLLCQITPHAAHLGPIRHQADNLGPITCHGKPLCHPDDRSQVTIIHRTLVVFWFSMLYELLLRKTVNQWAFNEIIIIIIVVVGKSYQIWTMCMLEMKFDPVKPVYNGHPWEMARWPLYTGQLCRKYSRQLKILGSYLLTVIHKVTTIIYIAVLWGLTVSE